MSFSEIKIDKIRLLRSLRDCVDADLVALVRRQHDIQQGATHAENRAEHAKDTRATEQGYLARGLAIRVEELQQTVGHLSKLEPVAFTASDPIALTALIVIRDENDEDVTKTWWLVPGAGGIELIQDETQIQTLTPASPLGRSLIGLYEGDETTLSTPSGRRHLEILRVF
jgi:transcription elongation GreA/GreB family factor